MVASYRTIPPDATVRLAKPTSNLFRARAKRDGPGLDTSGLTSVIAVDPQARTADVAGMCSYENLVAATLPHGLTPLVVPQLKTITLGGAVTGLGIESASFRNGLPHESVLEMDVLTGAGEIVTASAGQHADLYRFFPNSYGTLGYSVRLRIELEPVEPFVALRHLRFDSLADLIDTMDRIIDTRGYDGTPVDYLDGVVFSAQEAYLCLGTRTATPGPVSDYTGKDIYYRSIRHEHETITDRLTIHDYLWRWDTDWFWCSAGVGAQNRYLRPLIPKRYLRSEVYFKIIAASRRSGFVDRWDAVRGRPQREFVIQDIEVPVGRLAEFLAFFDAEVGISPVWLCPLRQRNPEHRWDLYVLRPDETYVNVGFWSSVAVRPGAAVGDVNRAIEMEVERLGGRKSLYSSAYYPVDDFWRIYNGQTYEQLRKRYDPDARLLDLYDKCVSGR